MSTGVDSPDGVFCELCLRDSDATRSSAWPHPFLATLRVSLAHSGALKQELRVSNTGATELSFTCALHTYFRVSDVKKATVTGLTGCTYLDNLNARTACVDESNAVEFKAETDRIYTSVPSSLSVIDGDRTVTLNTQNFPDAVVWNPWTDKAKALADFGDEEWREMVCVEAAVTQRPVKLAPGQQWSGAQTLSS